MHLQAQCRGETFGQIKADENEALEEEEDSSDDEEDDSDLDDELAEELQELGTNSSLKKED